MAENFTNAFYTNDNLFVLYGMNSASVDLIYLDPPFNSKRTYSAPIGSKAAGASFKDMWTWQDVNEAYLDKLVDHYPALVRYIQSVEGISGKPMMAYLVYMVQRLIEMHRVLKDTGSLYLHCDPTASHYLKVLCDSIFCDYGGRFLNEIVWERDSAGKGAKKTSNQYPRNIDVILYYSKSAQWQYFQPYTQKLTHKTLKEFRYIEEETGRKFKIVTLGDYSQKSIEDMRQKNMIYKTSNNTEYKKYYLDEFQLAIGSLWYDIPNLIHGKNKEYTGYPTQKPLALLKRIIESSTQEGDIILDPFCGCATTCVAAQQLQRHWISIDIEAKAADVLVERLSNDAGLFKDFIRLTDPPVRTDVVIEPANQVSIKKRLYTAQNGKCQACCTDFEMRNLEVDHIIPKAKGGGDYFENYQLLCASCNRIKGARPMEYLRVKIKAREELLKKDITFGA